MLNTYMREIAHDGHQLDPLELRELKRQLADGSALSNGAAK
jgi:hypothetical protein